MNAVQQRVIDAAIAICDNAANLPDGYAQVIEEITEELGEALSANSELEEEIYGKVLNSVEASLVRMNMDEGQLAIEQMCRASCDCTC